ncbi:MAG: molybdenum cofactor biosynthesis protein MoaE [Ardenticatenaceae bacterium]|nr:molybdenum cofactor biosynthesis protein MoaE [Ardenticatenaceae bacterium]HBY95250.1 molybdenum cofactor biosynthesis protein D/E [Chloroflexota bacterium]
MHITVRLFAVYREKTGQKQVTLELPEGATLRDAWEALVARYEGLGSFNHSIVGSVNAEYTTLSTPLRPDDEVAFIPPVAGGDHFAIVESPIDEGALRQAVEDPGAGAILIFLGTTRNQTGGRSVEYLEYEAYEPLALRQMETIAAEIRQRWPEVKGVALAHRVGRLAIGEASIGIAIATPHRVHAFAACRYAIDRAKESLPVWKKEVWEGGEEWIEEGPGVMV